MTKLAQKEEGKKVAGREVLVFYLGDEEFGLDISCVREILRPLEIHPLPQAPPFLEGVVNLREHIIAVVDLNKKFGIPTQKEPRQRRIIICRMRRFIIGLIVDHITEIVRLFEEDVDTAPDIVPAQSADSCIAGVARFEKRVITILDLEKFLTHEEAQNLASAKKA